MMKHFFSCDWGTTMFRLKLVDAESLSLIAEERNNNGILASNELWKKSNQDASFRLDFYLDIIQQQINLIEQKTGTAFNDVPLVISGMASSNLGMIELPYKQLPLDTNGADLQPHKILNQKQLPGFCIVIPGVSTNEDVMRGEETLLIGSVNSSSQEVGLYIFPGTHSKHVIVKNGKAVSIKTYMTGEFFDLLSIKSILSSSIQPTDSFEKHIDSFERGVQSALGQNILHSSFLVRTNSLFSKYSPEQNYFYLSGLLIGSELSELGTNGIKNIKLVSGKQLGVYYSHALEILDPKINIVITDAEEALVKGQWKVLRELL